MARPQFDKLAKKIKIRIEKIRIGAGSPGKRQGEVTARPRSSRRGLDLLRADFFRAGGTFFYDLLQRNLVGRVECGDFVALGQRGVIENGREEIVEPAPQAQHRL